MIISEKRSFAFTNLNLLVTSDSALLIADTKCHFPPLKYLSWVLVPIPSTRWIGGPFQSIKTSTPTSCTPGPRLNICFYLFYLYNSC